MTTNRNSQRPAVYFPVDLLQRTDQMATAEGLSRSAFIHKAIANYEKTNGKHI